MVKALDDLRRSIGGIVSTSRTLCCAIEVVMIDLTYFKINSKSMVAAALLEPQKYLIYRHLLNFMSNQSIKYVPH